MATAASAAAAAALEIKKQLSSITECSICCETFNDPRQLPCIHTYCLECIRGFSTDKLPGFKAPCPLCRKTFRIPDGGVDSLPKNFYFDQMKAILETCPAFGGVTTTTTPGESGNVIRCSVHRDRSVEHFFTITSKKLVSPGFWVIICVR